MPSGRYVRQCGFHRPAGSGLSGGPTVAVFLDRRLICLPDRRMSAYLGTEPRLSTRYADGALISVLGFGCGRVGSINNTVPMREIEATLRAAVEHGIDLFDTADIYAQGDSERTLSRLLAQYRDRMFVVTKVGGCHS